MYVSLVQSVCLHVRHLPSKTWVKCNWVWTQTGTVHDRLMTVPRHDVASREAVVHCREPVVRRSFMTQLEHSTDASRSWLDRNLCVRQFFMTSSWRHWRKLTHAQPRQRFFFCNLIPKLVCGSRAWQYDSTIMAQSVRWRNIESITGLSDVGSSPTHCHTLQSDAVRYNWWPRSDTILITHSQSETTNFLLYAFLTPSSLTLSSGTITIRQQAHSLSGGENCTDRPVIQSSHLLCGPSS